MTQQYDVCIIGGGFCGLILSHALRTIGFRCLLLEQRASLARPTDHRALVLSYGSGLILDQLGLWSQSLPRYPLKELTFSMRGRLGDLKLTTDAYQVPWLGQVVNAGEWFSECMQTSQLSDCWCDVTLKKISHENNGTLLTLQHNSKTKSILSDLVIGADGTDSWLSQQMKWPVTSSLAAHQAMVVPVQKVACGAWLRVAPVGTLAFIPHSEHHGVLIWTATESNMARLRNQKTFDRLTRQMAGHVFHKATWQFEHKQCFPVKAQLCQPSNVPGVICLGNALHTLPPVSAQGFNLGIRDCAMLIEHMVSWRQQHKTFQSAEFSAKFFQSREEDTRRTMRMSLAALKAAHWAKPWPLLSSLGLCAFSGLEPFYRSYVHQALGIGTPYQYFMKVDAMQHLLKKSESFL